MIIESKRYPVFNEVVIGTNTAIGGVAATLYDEATLAAQLGINASDITLFSIHGDDVYCHIGVEYSIPASCFEANNDITFFKDKGKVQGVLLTAFYNARNIVEVSLPGATFTRNGVFNTCFGLRVVNIPGVTTLGDTTGSNNVFANTLNIEQAYVHPDLETNNAGSPDGDLTDLPAETEIIYVTNTDKPEKIENLTVGTAYATALKLNFTVPNSTNAVGFFIVYIDGAYNSTYTDANNVYAAGLGISAEHTKITVVVADVFFNQSDHSNNVSGTTVSVANSPFPTIGLINLYQMEKTSGDVVDVIGSNPGTNVGATRGVPGINGKGFRFIKSHLEIPKPTITGTVSLNFWIKLRNHTPTDTAETGLFYLNTSDLYSRYPWTDGVIYCDFLTDTRKTIGTGVVADRSQWHMVTVTADTGTNEWKFYQNAELVHTDTVGTIPLVDIMKIGRISTTSNWMKGYLDGLQFNDTVLSLIEIQEIYNNGKGIPL